MYKNIFNAAQTIRRNRQIKLLSRLGYIANGVLHGLIGISVMYLALGSSDEVDQSGVLIPLVHLPFGIIILVLIGLGLLSLGTWQISHLVVTRKTQSANKKWHTQLIELAKGITYLIIGFSSLSFMFASFDTPSSTKVSQDFAAHMLGLPGGKFLLLFLGLFIAGIGIGVVHRGVSRNFLDSVNHTKIKFKKITLTLGIYGYIAKGIILLAVGYIFCQAALRDQPRIASGLDGAFRSFVALPLGVVLLALVGLGFIAYSIYSLIRSKYAKL